MATPVILPALGMAQETGKILQWLKAEGQQVEQGEPLAEIETDKATVELEAPVSGIISAIVAAAGDEVPVGQTIAMILSAQEAQSTPSMPPTSARGDVAVSPLAMRFAAEHHVDLSQVTPTGKRIQKADVQKYLEEREQQEQVASASTQNGQLIGQAASPRLIMASPKARRLAREQRQDLAALRGTGPGGAILALDVLAAAQHSARSTASVAGDGASLTVPLGKTSHEDEDVRGKKAATLNVGHIWRIMAERTTQSWVSVPHFSLVREVNAQRLMDWHKTVSEAVTYTDLLVKLASVALRKHPRLNAAWSNGAIVANDAINIGLAVAIDDGLIVPVISAADTLPLSSIAQRRKEMVTRAQTGKIRPEDLVGGTFTISNLGMYGVDAFNAIINTPQAAILAVGRITDRVVAINGQAQVRPMVILTLSCDHRVVDGAQAAQFLRTLVDLIEEPLGLLN
jgi:pyruvate dehydrogenase E2 component (dihydrolipoamide acetyltransferase)